MLLSGCTGVIVPDGPGATDIETGPTQADGELAIHHIDVGQADSTLIITPDGETILIDTGDWRQSGQQVIDYLDDLGVDRIDHLVSTHAHADHIGGHAEIIEYYETERGGVGAAYDNGVAHTSATYDRYLDAIETHDVDFFEVAEGDTLPLADDQLRATVLNPPEGDSGTDLHPNSVVLLFNFGEFGYLTTGDAEAQTEQRLVDDWGESLDVDAYQAGHHGSSTSSTKPFMADVDPSIVILSSGYDNQYGHPNNAVLDRFADRGVDAYWTGVHSDVVITTDGENVTVNTAESHSTDPTELIDSLPATEESNSLTANTYIPTISP